MSGFSSGGSSGGGSSGGGSSGGDFSHHYRHNRADNGLEEGIKYLFSYRQKDYYTKEDWMISEEDIAQKKEKYSIRKINWFPLIFIGILIIGIVAMVSTKAVQDAYQRSQEPRVKLDDSKCIRSNKIMDDRLGTNADYTEYLLSSGSDRKELSTLQQEREQALAEAMDYFYEKTGVQPYLVTCDNINGKKGNITDGYAKRYIKQLYRSLFEDEGHMIFVFMEYDYNQYRTYVYVGDDAEKVMDKKARRIFLDLADTYYNQPLSHTDFLVKLFTKSADKIMK